MTHPLVRTGRRNVAIGVTMAVGGAGSSLLLFGSAGVGVAAFAVLSGAFIAWNGRALMTSGVATPFLQESLALITRGRLDEAERAAEAIPPRLRARPMVARAISVHRALIALLRGDAAKAESLATESIAIRSGFFTQDWDGHQRTEALATRAIARAAQGSAAAALEDASAIEASAHALSPGLARAALARAIVFARSGDKAALGEHLKAHGSLILEHVMPRERSLARALRALARAPGKSVYREQARPSEEEGELKSWIGQVAPDAAGFAPREVFVEAPELPPRADPIAQRTIASARAAATPRPTRLVVRVIAAWVALVVLLVTAWQLLAPVETSSEDPPTMAESPAAPSLVVSGLVVGGAALALLTTFFVWWIGRSRKHQRRIFAAERAIALGRVQEGRRELLTLAAGPFPALASVSRLLLASLANREGRFAEAVVEADLGIGLANRNATTKALTRDNCIPGLLAERALALAAMDRFAEAETELAHLTNSFGGYSLTSRAIFRARLVSAVRRRDLAAAARIALSRRPEMPLDLKIDLLADVALAASGETMSADERERIATELRAMPEVSAWIDRVAGDLSRLRAPAFTSEAPKAEETAEDTSTAEAPHKLGL